MSFFLLIIIGGPKAHGHSLTVTARLAEEPKVSPFAIGASSEPAVLKANGAQEGECL